MSDDNKSKVKYNIGTSNEKTNIIEYSPVMEVDDNGIRILYDNDDSDEIDNDYNENNVNKPLLSNYHLS